MELEVQERNKIFWKGTQEIFRQHIWFIKIKDRSQEHLGL